jgi:DnaJ-class molecular chaperone
MPPKSTKLYDVLNVSTDASPDEVKKAFRKLAIVYHPDKCKEGDNKADHEEKFKQLNEAYTVLSDTDKRKRYDDFGVIDDVGMGGGGGMSMDEILKDMFGGGGPPGGFSFVFMNEGHGGPPMGMPHGFESIFGNMGMGGPRHRVNKADVVEVKVDINDVYYGHTKKVELEMLDLCDQCNGCGAQDPSHVLKCMTCHGNGVVHQQVGPFFSQQVTCPSCVGQGSTVQHNKQCHKCNGKKTIYTTKIFELKLPKGLPNHYEVSMENKGSYNPDNKRHNDIKFKFTYDIKEPYIIDKDMNVHYKMIVKLEELLTGFNKTIDIYKEKMCLSSDHYFDPCKPLVIEGKGLYNMACEKQKDLYIHFEIEYSVNDRFKKYVDVLRKVLKMPHPQQPAECGEGLIMITKSDNNL